MAKIKSMEVDIPEINAVLERLSQIEEKLGKINTEYDRWVPNKEVPTLLGISVKTWYEYRRNKLIPFAQNGKVILVKYSDINNFLESKLVGRRNKNQGAK